MTKELAKKGSDDLITPEHANDIWKSFATSEIDRPRIMVMQKTSKMADGENIKAGDIVTNSKEILAKRGSSVEFIIVKQKREIMHKVSDKEVKFLPYNRTNEELLNADSFNEKPSYYSVITMAILLKDRLGSNPIPYEISFVKSNYRVAKKINTILATLDKRKYLPFSKVFVLGSEAKSYEGYDWWAFDVVSSESELTEHEKAVAYEWYAKLQEVNDDAVKSADDLEF